MILYIEKKSIKFCDHDFCLLEHVVFFSIVEAKIFKIRLCRRAAGWQLADRRTNTDVDRRSGRFVEGETDAQTPPNIDKELL